MRSYLLATLFLSLYTRCALQDVYSNQSSFPTGDPRNCKFTSSMNKMEVLPGVGWDNLVNLDKGQVLATNYSQCKTTADGKYLLPDHVFVVPIKESKLDLFSEIYDHWSDYKSSTAFSINVGASFFSVASGSFSFDYQYNKERQVNDYSFTTRVSLRHQLYTVKAEPDAALSKPFRNRVLDIASNLQNNKSDMAWYNAQLLIRDFGTHYTTSVDAGAALMKEDHIKNTFQKDATKSSADIKAAASATLFKKISLSMETEFKTSQEYLNQYVGNQTTSRITTHGGPAFGANFTVNDWEKGLKNELVPINRDGDLLHYTINTATLPNLPIPTVSHVAKLVEEAISLYYKVNTIPGCTDSASSNFYFQANIDDGSCKHQAINFTFGGVFQKCYSLYNGAGNLCDKLEQKNPLTGDFSCPDGYDAVDLIKPAGRRPRISKSYHKTQCHQSCHACGFLWLKTCCKNYCENVLYYSQAEYESFWCAAKGEIPQSTGYLFGGVYSSNSPNPITGSQKCPSRFYPRALGGHSYVCISDDYELGFQYSLKFAGFFSCSAGNPLAIPMKSNGSQLTGSSSTLELFLAGEGGGLRSNGVGEKFYGPKHCPHGYSQHVVTVDNGCEINYCIKANSFKDQKLNPVRSMPFSPKPGVNPNTTEAILIVGVNGQVWAKNLTTGDWELKDFSLEPTTPDSSDKDLKSGYSHTKRLSNGATAAISVSVTSFICILIAVLVFGFKKHRKTKTYKGKGLLDSYVDSERSPLNPPGNE